jgi:hypothetical protein
MLVRVDHSMAYPSTGASARIRPSAFRSAQSAGGIGLRGLQVGLHLGHALPARE